MSFISDTFVSHTGWDLIKNNKNLRYHNVHKENQYNCIERPAFKSERNWLEYQSILRYNRIYDLMALKATPTQKSLK